MLYERWRQVAREFPEEVALRDLASGRAWTFADLDATAQEPGDLSPIVFPRGNTTAFVIGVLRAWRHNQVTCPLESSQAMPSLSPPLPADIVHLKLSSATSGAAKVIAFTGEQLAADTDNIVATMGLRRDWPNVGFISLAHSYGFSNLVTPLLLHGIPLILAGSPLPEVLRATERFPGITVPAVPALWRAWTDARAIPSSLRLAISAGAPLPCALEDEVFRQFGVKLHNFYGASECGGIAYDATSAPRSDGACAGTPIRNVALSINDAGCLEIRGPSVGMTYLPEPSPALRDGVYSSNDLAEIKEGQVFLRGRASEMINVAGRKVLPETIERLLSEHPAVRDCLVFGVESTGAHRGETIVACVVQREATTVDELRQFVFRQSEPWQTPREFWFVESLETNARGKLSRMEWRARYLRERQRAS
jgi:acyl-CoA synthetase (AMP-forming)/AMP-acid ligase II